MVDSTDSLSIVLEWWLCTHSRNLPLNLMQACESHIHILPFTGAPASCNATFSFKYLSTTKIYSTAFQPNNFSELFNSLEAFVKKQWKKLRDVDFSLEAGTIVLDPESLGAIISQAPLDQVTYSVKVWNILYSLYFACIPWIHRIQLLVGHIIMQGVLRLHYGRGHRVSGNGLR